MVLDIFLLFLCLQVLIDWINDVLVEERIIVKQLEEDLYDGQVLQKLLGESTQEKVTLKTGGGPKLTFSKAAECAVTQHGREIVDLTESCLSFSICSPQVLC